MTYFCTTFLHHRLLVRYVAAQAALFLLPLFLSALWGEIVDFELEEIIEKGVEVQLKNPSYADGILSTKEGGVIETKDLRIQANEIVYKKVGDCEHLTASGDLLVEFGEYIFVGKSLEYDFIAEKGSILRGRTSAGPWYFGGETIKLCSDRSIMIIDGFITTSAGSQPDWEVTSDLTVLKCNRYLTAKNVKFMILNTPLLWLPKFKADLRMIFDSPIRYGFRFGGKQGPRCKMIYEVFSWCGLKTLLRFEYRLNRGPGLGVITNYNAPDRSKKLEMINYFARDSSINDRDERYRYRFQGLYSQRLNCGRTQVHASWDKLSDKEMPEDYNDETLKIEEAGRTELLLRHQESSWVANMATRLQVNSFQTVKQELPSIEWRFHPYSLFKTGVVSETVVRAGFLDYDYASGLQNVHDYSSTRFELRQNFYRSFTIGPLSLLPEAGMEVMYYGSSPQKEAREVTSGLFSLQARTHLYRFYGDEDRKNKRFFEFIDLFLLRT